MGIITANPTLYLREVCQKVFEATNIVVSASTICRILFRNGLTMHGMNGMCFSLHAAESFLGGSDFLDLYGFSSN